MTHDITIPLEALEAAAIDLYRAIYPEPDYHSWTDTPEWMRELKRKYARAACLAMLNAWPVMHIHEWQRPWLGGMSGTDIILPLTENTND